MNDSIDKCTPCFLIWNLTLKHLFFQICQTLDLIFTAAADGFSQKDVQLLQLAHDVFEEILTFHTFGDAVKR